MSFLLPIRYAYASQGQAQGPSHDLLTRQVPFFSFSFVVTFAGIGCGGGSSAPPPPPPSITFSSTPVTSASEGAQYSYQLAATSSNSSSVTFALTTAPSGATLSGSTISWTPTHAESRVSNSFTVTAATSAGGSATQSWTVTPNGTVNITAVTTYWTPSGSTSVSPQWNASLPYPAALIPQSDGSLQRLQGSANADGSFSIPDVPAGYYWLQINPNANYWTSASDFDDGVDLLGHPLSVTAQTTTIINTSASGLQSSPSASYLQVQSDLRGGLAVDFLGGSVPPNTTTFTSSARIGSDIDWSKITTLYFSQYELNSSGSFFGFVLGPTQTLPNVSINNGATNQITAALSPSSPATLPLSITGTAWAGLVSSVAPSAPTPAFSDYAAFVQPYVTDRFAVPTSALAGVPDFALFLPSPPSSTSFLLGPPLYGCGVSTGPTIANIGLQPILTDVDYGMLSYGDPYPPNWLRLFQYCQVSTVSLPRPNSTATDTFLIVNRQTTPLSSASPVAPLLSPVQSPMLNGSSLFTSATLNSTNVSISWNPPATGQPFGYYISVYQLTTSTTTGQTFYAPAGRYATAKTSLSVPFLAPTNTYVFTIVTVSDASANIEKNPNRHKIPSAEAAVVSAPFVIQ